MLHQINTVADALALLSGHVHRIIQSLLDEVRHLLPAGCTVVKRLRAPHQRIPRQTILVDADEPRPSAAIHQRHPVSCVAYLLLPQRLVLRAAQGCLACPGQHHRLSEKGKYLRQTLCDGQVDTALRHAAVRYSAAISAAVSRVQHYNRLHLRRPYSGSGLSLLQKQKDHAYCCQCQRPHRQTPFPQHHQYHAHPLPYHEDMPFSCIVAHRRANGNAFFRTAASAGS